MQKTQLELVREHIINYRETWLEELSRTIEVTLYEINSSLEVHQRHMAPIIEDESPMYKKAYIETASMVSRIDEVIEELSKIHKKLSEPDSPLMVPKKALNYEEKKEIFKTVKQNGSSEDIVVTIGDTKIKLSGDELKKILGTL